MRSVSVSVVLSATAGGLLSSAVFAGGIPPLQPKAGEPLQGLTKSELQLFEAGKVLYSTPLTIEDGLGPIFNKPGCFSCHAVPLGGWGSISVTRFGFEDKRGNFDPLDALGGSLLQLSAISESCLETVPEESNIQSIRVTNSSLAFGLVEAIPDADIAANADETDLDGDGISGRARWVVPFESRKAKVGRFGWKAQLATVLSFSADASRMEMGLSNRFIPTDAAPNGDEDLLGQCDTVADPEDHPDAQGYDFVDRVTHFQRYLGVPPQTPKTGMTGETVFNAIGCAKCHVAEWTTSNNPRLEAAIRNKTIRPYSDFLLHDMTSQGDGISDEFASGSEFRTPTLWNLRTRDPMLHDGTATGGTFEARVVDAILAHGPEGEGAESAAAFENLTSIEQEQLVAFLGSLGRLEFDIDGDNQINYADVIGVAACFGDTGLTPDDACAVADIDQDGDVDLTDALAFDVAYPGPSTDCNRNGIPDIADIVAGTSVDADQDGLPDECVPCPADLDVDGQVNGADLAVLLGGWGGSEYDLTGDFLVDGADLAVVLGAWGLCQ